MVLETIQDPGNLGTILRAGEGAGVTGIVMDANTADIYNPKVIRSTMGSVLRMPFVYVENLHETLEELKKMVEEFDGCALKLTANKTVFGYGSGTARLLLIGEAPGADEDRSGIPFVGRSGQLLEKMLKAIGFDRNECFITNVLPWRPPGNRTPTEGEIAVCLPFLKRQIDLVSPEAIMILGGSAANALLDNGEPISRMRGKWLEYKKSDGGKVPVLASFHPAYLLRNSGQKAKAWVDMLRMKQKLCNN